jgi:hypothetical protein
MLTVVSTYIASQAEASGRPQEKLEAVFKSAANSLQHTQRNAATLLQRQRTPYTNG